MHWLPIELSKVIDSANKQLNRLKEGDQELNFTMLNKSFTINVTDLMTTSLSVEKCCDMYKLNLPVNMPIKNSMLIDDSLFSIKLAFSAMIAVHLDRFMFSGANHNLGYVLHQALLGTRKEHPRCQTCICQNLDNTYGNIVALGDLKRHDMNVAVREAVRYCSTSSILQNRPYIYPAFMAIPGSQRINGHNYMHSM